MMQSGYLLIETLDGQPGLVRLRVADSLPAESDPSGLASGEAVQYAARFDDISAARMHAHNLLRRGLVDLEEGLYRSAPTEAAAAVDSIALRHHRVYLAPELANHPELAAAVTAHRRTRGRRERTWQILGMAAALFLIAKVLLGF